MACKYELKFITDCYPALGTYYRKMLYYCHGEGYRKCPFYKIKEGQNEYCEYFLIRPEGGNFYCSDFESFIATANEYCLSNRNCKKCYRYKIRKENKVPPHDLMPDGSSCSV